MTSIVYHELRTTLIICFEKINLKKISGRIPESYCNVLGLKNPPIPLSEYKVSGVGYSK